MDFYSIAFFLFVAFFIILHELVGRIKSEYQWIVRLIASMTFYVAIARWRILFLAISIVTAWIGAVSMDRIAIKGKEAWKASELSKEEKSEIKRRINLKKRIVLFLVITINLVILALVKYVMPQSMHVIILPLGISFYSFMLISYMIDVYGGKYEAEKNIFKVALYLSWFPQILQGPINRFDYMRKTIYERSTLTYENLKINGLLFLFGAIKKYALADILSPWVNEIFARESLADIPGSFLLFTAFLFAIEQYADFSGGIDMAIAVSQLFGVKMNINFRQPYFSKSLSEFWRRWHISLGSFLRDYVFYPLALLPKMLKLNEKISQRYNKHIGRSVIAGIGNLIVFMIVGLWHGSALHYIAWGLYNGIIIVISDFMTPLFTRWKESIGIKKENKIFTGFQIFRTFMIIVLASYFDAVEDVSNGFECFKNTFFRFNISQFKAYCDYIYDCKIISDIGIIVCIISVIIILVHSIFKENKKDLFEFILSKSIVIRWTIYLVMIYVVLFGFAASGGTGGFMYAVF